MGTSSPGHRSLLRLRQHCHLSWLTRAGAKASAADRLPKPYSMVCMTYGIQLVPFHTPEVNNHLADIISCYQDCHEDPNVTQLSATIASYSLPPKEFIAMVTAHYDQLQSRGLQSRTIFMAAVFRHSHYAYEEILLLVNLLILLSIGLCPSGGL